MCRSRDVMFHSTRFVHGRRMLFGIAVFLLSFALAVGEAVAAEVDDPVTLENVGNPGKNDPNEPLAEKFSAAKAAHYLDVASVGWQKTFGCMTCHTDYLYLLSRPNVSSDVLAHFHPLAITPRN